MDFLITAAIGLGVASVVFLCGTWVSRGKPPTISDLREEMEDTTWKVAHLKTYVKMKLGSPETRRQALHELADTGDPRAMLELMKTHAREEGLVPVETAQMLAKLKDMCKVPQLVAALKTQEEPIRVAASAALGNLGAQVVPSLVAVLKAPKSDLDTRLLVARTLGYVGNPGIEPLVELLQGEVVPLREAAAESLGRIAREESAAALVPVLRDSEESVARIAAESLVRIGRPAVPALIPELESEDPVLQKCAQRALDDVIEAIPARTRCGAWSSMTPSPESCRLLERLVHAPDRGLRRVAVSLLAALAAPAAMPGLLAALDLADEEIGVMAERALIKVGPSAVDPLLQVLKKGHLEARARAGAALAAIGDTRALRPMIALVSDPDVPTRAMAVKAIGGFREQRTMDILAEAIGDPERSVQDAAIAALQAAGSTAAVYILLDALQSGNEDLQERVAGALGEIGDARATEGLRAVMPRSDSVRRAAIRALAKLGSRRLATQHSIQLPE